jgi:hypothetical protein
MYKHPQRPLHLKSLRNRNTTARLVGFDSSKIYESLSKLTIIVERKYLSVKTERVIINDPEAFI